MPNEPIKVVWYLKKNPFIQVYIWLEKGLYLDGATLSFVKANFIFRCCLILRQNYFIYTLLLYKFRINIIIVYVNIFLNDGG